MSHFSVMVIGHGPNSIVEAMAPFQENNMGDCQPEYMEFNDIEDEYLERYNTEMIDRIRTTDGALMSPYDDAFKDRNAGKFSNKYTFPEGYEKVEVPIKECYASFEDFMSDYCGYTERNEEYGRYGYMENPNAKWDWYQVGGRWAGFLLLKADASNGVRGEQSLLMEGDAYEGDDLRVDAAMHKDIDWEGMMKANVEQYGKYWDDAMEKAKERDKPESEWISEFHTMEKDMHMRFDNMCETHGREKTWQTFRLWSLSEPFGVSFVRYKDKESYVAQNCVPTTFAYLKDGKWGERGEMGWFGFTANEKDCKTWEQEFETMLETLDPETWITIVDAHI